MASLASIEQLSDRLGIELDPESSDGIRAQAALDDASNLIRSVAGKTWEDDHGDLDDVPAIVTSVTLAVAYRAFRNPDGTSQSSLGDVSVSFSRGGAVGALFLTPTEEKAIKKAAGTTVTSVLLETDYLINTKDYHYANPNIGGDPIPMGPFPWEV